MRSLTLFDPDDLARPRPAAGARPADRRLRRHRFHGFAGNPGRAPPSGARSSRRSSGCCATASSSPAPAAPTRACTPRARWSTSTPARASTSPRLRPGAQRLCGPPSPCGSRRWWPTTSRPLRRPRRRYRYTILNPPVPDPFSVRPPPGTCRTPSTSTGCGLACDPLIGEPRLRVVLPRPPRRRRGASTVRDVHDARWEEGDGDAALLHRGDVVLPPDGALDRRHPGRRRPAASARPAT